MRCRRVQLQLLDFSFGRLEGSLAAAVAAHLERCADCRRTPLVGERVHRYEDGRLCCELCRPLRRDEPVGSELVLGSEHGHAVRITRAAA